jgi:four helix bundle protein
LRSRRKIANKPQIPNAEFQTDNTAWGNRRAKIRMQNDKAKFKDEFKRRVYRFALDIIEFVDRLPVEQTSRIIADQLVRSTTSIGANVIEAQAASSRKDYTNFFAHALKSANECKFWLGLLRDSGRGDKEIVNGLLREATEIGNILATSILTLKGKR